MSTTVFHTLVLPATSPFLPLLPRHLVPILLLIALVGVLGVAVLLERLYVIVYRSRTNGRVFIERIIQLVHAGKIDEAIRQCTVSTAALPDIGLLMLRSRSRDETDLENLANAAALAVLPRLTRRLQYLSALSAVAIMLGALGTIRGVRDTMLAVSTISVVSPVGPANTGGVAASDRTAQLLAGFADALIPFGLGLAVAIVLTLGRAYPVSQAESITEQIREFSARLINALIDRPDVRL